jgi:hypothetical protein
MISNKDVGTLNLATVVVLCGVLNEALIGSNYI